MPNVTIDGHAVTVESGATILEAAETAGISIPTLCHARGEEASVSCMVCVVAVEGMAKLVPSCAMPVADGMKIFTDTPEVLAARRRAVELLLSHHAGDCAAPCELVCPASWRIPQFLRDLRDGKKDQAAQRIREDLLLPEVLGHICPAPCEKACRRGRHDAPVAIRALHRAVAAESQNAFVFPVGESTDKRVGVVGAGPAGIGAAAVLRRQGHACVMLEKADVVGGGLHKIPNETLPRESLGRDLAALERLQLSVHTGYVVDDEPQLADLCSRFDAVILTGGEGNLQHLGLEMTDVGIRVDPVTGVTSRERVFAAGGCVKPIRAMAVRALAQGRAAGEAVCALLADKPVSAVKRYEHRLGGLHDGEMAVFLREAEESVCDEEAHADAAGRCLHCDCRAADACRLRKVAEWVGVPRKIEGATRPDVVQDRTHPDLAFEPGKCIVCGTCIRIARRAGEAAPPAFIGRGFQLRVSAGSQEGMAKALKHSAADCIAACPTGALAWKRNGGDA